MDIGLSDTSGQLDHARVAELLARRWTEDRPYFTAIGTVWRGKLQASWHRGPRHTLYLRWSRRAAVDFERGQREQAQQTSE
jgi:hypothetical protein